MTAAADIVDTSNALDDMPPISRPILYVGNEHDSLRAVELLRGAGFDVEVRDAPSYYRVAYGTPVLFGLSNRFEGLEGIEVFLENASLLGLSPRL